MSGRCGCSRSQDRSTRRAIRHVAGMLGMSPETLRLWQRRYEVNHGKRSGVTTEAAAEIKRLQRENAERRKANKILKAASIFFAKEPGRPRRDDLVHH